MCTLALSVPHLKDGFGWTCDVDFCQIKLGQKATNQHGGQTKGNSNTPLPQLS